MPIGSWEAVTELTHGEKLEVMTQDGKTFKGVLDSVTATTLTLWRGNNKTEYKREDVRRVYWRPDKSSSTFGRVPRGALEGVKISGDVLGAGLGASVEAVSATVIAATANGKKRILLFAR